MRFESFDGFERFTALYLRVYYIRAKYRSSPITTSINPIAILPTATRATAIDLGPSGGCCSSGGEMKLTTSGVAWMIHHYGAWRAGFEFIEAPGWMEQIVEPRTVRPIYICKS
jgi:hypothetical protein